MINMKQLWRPIETLTDKYQTGLLLCAPELVDLDCNPHGIAPGFWQDDGKTWHMTQKEILEIDLKADMGCFLCAQWSMTNDEWYVMPCNPTHYIIMEGPR